MNTAVKSAHTRGCALFYVGAGRAEAAHALGGEEKLPDTVTYIADDAFYDSDDWSAKTHSALREIALPQSLKTIGERAFYHNRCSLGGGAWHRLRHRRRPLRPERLCDARADCGDPHALSAEHRGLNGSKKACAHPKRVRACLRFVTPAVFLRCGPRTGATAGRRAVR